jgi:putative endonuclease
VEQLVARWAHNPKVIGSSPVPATTKAWQLPGFFVFMFTVYVLYSEAHHKHYTGFSSDFEARLLSHNHLGKKDWTTRYRPWKVLYTEVVESKSAAIQREKWLKSGVGREFIKKLPH